MQQLLQMLVQNKNNPQALKQLDNNPMMLQAKQMLNSGQDPKQLINNIAKQKGIDPNKLNQIANQFGIKL